MDKLVEFLTEKIGWTVLVILGFLLPGSLFVFVWDRALFLEMELIRLIILAASISFMIFAANFIVISYCAYKEDKEEQKRADLELLIVLPVILADLEMSVAMLYKINNPQYTVCQFLNHVVIVLLFILVIELVELFVKKRIRKAKERKRK